MYINGRNRHIRQVLDFVVLFNDGTTIHIFDRLVVTIIHSIIKPGIAQLHYKQRSQLNHAAHLVKVFSALSCPSGGSLLGIL